MKASGSDPGALATLVENHRSFLRLLEPRVGSRETAEDTLQDAFGRAVSQVDSLRDEGAVVPWFYRTLRNAVVDHYRRKDASRRALEAFGQDLEDAARARRPTPRSAPASHAWPQRSSPSTPRRCGASRSTESP